MSTLAPIETNPPLFTTNAAARQYILGGRAIITVVSTGTNRRYTFKISKAKNQDGLAGYAGTYFVGLLTGPDNTTDYQYLGFLRPNRFGFIEGLIAGKKGNFSHPAFKGFDWVWRHLNADRSGLMDERLEIWHEGSCGRCGRKLTVPESIASGFGPICRGEI